MAESQLTIELPAFRTEILSWIAPHVEDKALEWLSSKSEGFTAGVEDWNFFSSFSAVPRHAGSHKLNLTEEQVQKASEFRPGWKPGSWTTEQLGRALLLLSSAGGVGEEKFIELLDKTFDSSDMGEAEALYKSLAILPWPERHKKRAAEGIRHNITSVFNAVTLRNPYAADYLEEDPWNQLVLKAIFVGSPLYLIEGIDRRANETLANILVDYAHERWAAGRTLTPELWRPMGPFATGKIIDDLEKVLGHDDEIQRQAAYLALSASPDSKAGALIEKHPGIGDSIEKESVTWDSIGERFHKKKSS